MCEKFLRHRLGVAFKLVIGLSEGDKGVFLRGVKQAEGQGLHLPALLLDAVEDLPRVGVIVQAEALGGAADGGQAGGLFQEDVLGGRGQQAL